MSFSDWEKFQFLAKELVTRADEAMFRSAINRSYYASFQTSISFAEAFYSFVKDRTGEDHKRIIEELRSKKDKFIKQVSRDLSRLKDNRRKADYDERIAITQPIASVSVQMADDIIQSLKNYSPTP